MHTNNNTGLEGMFQLLLQSHPECKVILSLSKDKTDFEPSYNFINFVSMNLYVYIVECSDGSFYAGVTNDVDHRFSEHNEGLSKKAYTYRKRPVKLEYHEVFTDPNYAIAVEKQIKGWSRKKKIALIKGEWEKLPELSRSKSAAHTSTGSV